MERHLGIGHILIRDEGKIPSGDHGGGVALHDGCRLHMQVAQHFIATPPPNELDPVVIDAGAQKGHGAGSAEGSS